VLIVLMISANANRLLQSMWEKILERRVSGEEV
jgi:hypothetical protein